MKANRLILDKRNTLAVDCRNAFAVLWAGATQELAAALDSCGGDVIGVQFRTYSETAKAVGTIQE